MSQKTAPSFFVFVLFLILPLHVSAMESVFNKTTEEKEFAEAAAVRAREREGLATEPDQNNSSSFARAVQGSSGAREINLKT